ncbi:hypothetical protein NLJ89_g4909 [Agrocybe chaxingu]|uniref:Uncharacterized protein n=1 Tax=Agrocybe chaxingu TaxID=84603 RepID=A0A9W8K2B1_9AGAR|nr:hypothetical protein NLJ89_g4909 [Agrocybe chaxingu]
MIPIRKNNFISHYSKAREKAFSKSTIISAWKKTGIVPFDRTAIPPEAYAPALNTTTKAAQPIPATVPAFMAPNEAPTSSEVDDTNTPSPNILHAASSNPSSDNSPSTASSRSTESTKSIEELTDDQYLARMTTEQMYEYVGLPPRCQPRAGREELRKENILLRNLLDKSCMQMQRDYALKKLMDRENECLRQRLFDKENKPSKKKKTNLQRHLTSEENLAELALDEWKSAMKILFASDGFKAHKKSLADKQKAAELEEKENEKKRKEVRERERERKKREEEEKKRERAHQKSIKDAEKAAVKQAKAVEREAARAARAVAAEEKRAAAAAKKEEREKKKAVKAKKGGKGKKQQLHNESDESDDEPHEVCHSETPLETHIPSTNDTQREEVVQPRPRPHPVPRRTAGVINMGAVELMQEMGPTRRLARRACPN